MRHLAPLLLAIACGCAATPSPQPEMLESIPGIDWQKGMRPAAAPAGAEISMDDEWMERWLQDPLTKPRE